MWKPWLHIDVIVYYKHNFYNYLRGVGGAILVMASIFLFMGLTPSHVIQKPKYSILVFPKKDISILHLSHFSLSLLSVDSNLHIWSFQSTLVRINISSMHTRMNPNLWIKSFIFCWNCLVSLQLLLADACTGIFSTKELLYLRFL